MGWQDSAIPLVEEFEGFRSCPYQDQGGVWTIGYGTTRLNGVQVTGATPCISQGQAIYAMIADMMIFHAAVLAHVTKPMSAQQEAAMTSLAYNIGVTHFVGSTVLRNFNAGDIQGAADAFRMWNEVNGQVNPGLVRRREAERALFLQG